MSYPARAEGAVKTYIVDRRTRKLMTMNKDIYLRVDIDRLTISEKSERELASI